MSELDKLLGDIREKTGTEIRLAPHGGEETGFFADCLGAHTQLWIDGSGAEAERVAALVKYLLERGICGTEEKGLKEILLGEGGQWQAFRFLTKYNLSDAPCYAVDMTVDKNVSDALLHVERCLEGGRDLFVQMDSTRIAVVKFSGDGQTPYEFGEFLSRSLYEELGIHAGVGIGCEAKTFSEIAGSYNQAVTATRMSGIFESKGSVHTYREYLLVHMLEDIPQTRINEYLEQFRVDDASEIFEDAEMSGTAEEFLESSLNASETSRKLFMHRNTLMYRLDKIERISGLNIRKFSDAVTFRVISILYKLLNN